MFRFNFNRSRKLSALWLAIAVMSFYTTPALAVSNDAPPLASGQVVTARGIMINGLRALSGQTFFSGSTFTTPADSLSVIALNNRGRIELSAETTLQLSFTDSGITGALNAGRVRVAAPAGVLTSINARDVSLVSDSGQPALFSVHVEGDGMDVSVEAGQLKVIRGDETQVVNAGSAFSSVSLTQTQSVPRQNLSGAGKVGIALGIAGAVTLLAFIISGEGDTQPPEDPCIHVLSAGVTCP